MPSPMTTECKRHECRRTRAEMQKEIDRLRTEVGELHMHAKRRDEYATKKALETLTEVMRANAAEEDAERWRFCVERDVMPVIANDGKTWCMFVSVTSTRRSLFTGNTPSEAVDAAIDAARRGE